MTGTTEKSKITVSVKKSETSAYCPTPEHELWNQHPRIFIRLDNTKKEATCPYCSTKFKLVK